ncbi:MAG: ABC transporter ATP-binding protein [Phycisphaerae bacterium]|nr:ABC transporter ATP-binding protein [Phycisphaerae bacterium]
MAQAVEVRGFTFGYTDTGAVLTDITLSIEHGEKVALIGPNGAGKSTLLLAMSVFIQGSGTILIDGIEATRKNAKEVRSVIGSVLQNPDEQLFMPTLFEDVAFGPMNMGLSRQEVVARSMRAIATVGLAGMEDRPPHHLSAGQKRAAAVATILSMSPKIITMDEPDTSLDPRSRNNLIALLASLEQTFIIATCSMEFAAALCSRAILIDGGRVIADGPAALVMSDAELMRAHGLETPAAFRDRSPNH